MIANRTTALPSDIIYLRCLHKVVFACYVSEQEHVMCLFFFLISGFYLNMFVIFTGTHNVPIYLVFFLISAVFLSCHWIL